MKTWIQESQPKNGEESTAVAEPGTGRLEAVATPAAEAVEPAAKGPRPTYPADEGLRAKLRDFKETHRWSNADLGMAIGYSPAVSLLYLAPAGNQYDGDTGAVESKVREFLRDQQLILDTGIETVASEVSERIEGWLEDIRTSRGFGVIVAEAGLGKSRGVDLYLAAHSLAIGLNAWEGECSRASAEDLLFRAADVMRTSTRGGKARALVAKMRGSPRMIVVDDAHYLSRAAISLFSGFRDRTGMSIAFVGIPKLMAKLESDPQVLSRINFSRQITWKRLQKVDVIIDHHIRSLIGETNGEQAELRKLCRQIAAHDGHFRSLQQQLARAVRLHRGNKAWSWCECVRNAHACLIRDYELS